MKLNLKTILLTFTLVSFIIWLSIGINKLNNGVDDAAPTIAKSADTYLDILPVNLITAIKPKVTYLNKNNSPIATFSANDYSYDLIIMKLEGIIKGGDFKQILKRKRKEFATSIDTVFNSSIKIEGFQTITTFAKAVKSKNLFYYIKGDDFKELYQSDSLTSFKVNLKNIAISYLNDSGLIFNCKQELLNFDTLPFEMVLLKKNDQYYILFKAINRPNSLIAKKHLYSYFISSK